MMTLSLMLHTMTVRKEVREKINLKSCLCLKPELNGFLHKIIYLISIVCDIKALWCVKTWPLFITGVWNNMDNMQMSYILFIVVYVHYHSYAWVTFNYKNIVIRCKRFIIKFLY